MEIIIFTTLALSLINLLCIFIALARLFNIKSSSSDISSQNFDRLERKLAEANKNTRQELTENAAQLRKELSENITSFRHETAKSAQEQREEFARTMQRFQEAFDNSTGKSVEAQKERFAELDKRQKELLDATEKKLEDIRLMVDEKLQNTLNERLGQSFKVVSEQLENVQKGLGEMKNLASDVGGIREIANDQRGRVQAAHDEKQLLDNVNFMLDHCGEFNRKDIREYAERNFAVEVIGKQILRAYDFALGATHQQKMRVRFGQAALARSMTAMQYFNRKLR